jgi:glycosyltransferase involved in cell wall biosynthesis
MSEKVLRDLNTFSSKKAVLVPHPLYDNFGDKISKEVARKELGISNEELILLFFGFIRKYKGLDILLDAVKILTERSLIPNSQSQTTYCRRILRGSKTV